MQEPFYSVDLSVEENEDRCVCRVLRSPAGEATCEFLSPFSPRELAELPHSLTRRAEPGEETDFRTALARQAGENMSRAALHGKVRDCLNASLETAYEAGSTLRIRVQFQPVARFDSLPWEYLFDIERDEYFALSTHTPMTRYVEQMHQILPLEIDPPLRMLVVIAGPAGYPDIAVGDEWLNLLDTLDYLAVDGKLFLEHLQRPTLFGLQRQLRAKEYHLLHIISHGIYDGQTQAAHLVFEDDAGRSRFVSGQHLGELMRDHYSLRLLTIDGRGVRDAPDNPFVAVADDVVRRGVPAAVALPPELETSERLAFIDGFYAKVADLAPVDSAVVAGREAMRTQFQSAAWGLPVISTRIADGGLFEDSAQLAAAEDVAAPHLSDTNSLLIRTANRDTIAGWRDNYPRPQRNQKREPNL